MKKLLPLCFLICMNSYAKLPEITCPPIEFVKSISYTESFDESEGLYTYGMATEYKGILWKITTDYIKANNILEGKYIAHLMLRDLKSVEGPEFVGGWCEMDPKASYVCSYKTSTNERVYAVHSS